MYELLNFWYATNENFSLSYVEYTIKAGNYSSLRATYSYNIINP